MKDTISIVLSWDFGYGEESREVTWEELKEILSNGIRYGEHEVTSILTFPSTTKEYQQRMGAVPAEANKLLD